MAVNFRTLYLSQNPEEFWKRWHVTLSSWIRDYLYIPLGGSRRGEGRAYLNLVIAMALSGLWHGAAWTFVVWGVFHGLLSALHKFWSRRVLKPLGIARRGAWVRWLSVFLMLNPAVWRLTPLVTGTLPLILFLALLHGAERWFREREETLRTGWQRLLPSPVRALVYVGVAALVVLLLKTGESTFIYCRF